MKLDSVRGLKLSLREKLVVETPTLVRSFALLSGSTRSFSQAPKTPPTMALGVTRKGKNDFQLAVRLQQRAMEGSHELKLITRQAKGEVDVRYVGAIQKRATKWYQKLNRPLRIGCSIGHFRVTAGTLGTFVRPCGGGPLHMLSNNHVLAHENRSKKGDPILQPGQYDGGENPEDMDGVPIKVEVVGKISPR